MHLKQNGVRPCSGSGLARYRLSRAVVLNTSFYFCTMQVCCRPIPEGLHNRQKRESVVHIACRVYGQPGDGLARHGYGLNCTRTCLAVLFFMPMLGCLLQLAYAMFALPVRVILPRRLCSGRVAQGLYWPGSKNASADLCCPREAYRSQTNRHCPLYCRYVHTTCTCRACVCICICVCMCMCRHCTLCCRYVQAVARALATSIPTHPHTA